METEQENLLLPDETLTEVNEGLSLIQKKHGLTFGTDALLLAAFAGKNPKGQAAELGAGSGIVTMLCAVRKKFRHIDAIEVQSEYAALCERNFKRNGLGDTAAAIASDIRDFRAPERAGVYQTVLTNPPYMTCDSGYPCEYTEKNAARHEVFGGISDFCACAAYLLSYGGSFYCVYRPDRLTDLLCAMRENGIEPKKLLLVCRDALHEPSMVLCEGKRGAKPHLAVPKPFFLYENDGVTMTDALRGVYERGELLL